MNNNITRLKERSTRQIFYANQTEFFEVSYNAGVTSSDGQTVSFVGSRRMGLGIHFDKFHKYSQIKSIRLIFKTTTPGVNITLHKVFDINSNLMNVCSVCTTNSSGFAECDLIDSCSKEQETSNYFSVEFSRETQVSLTTMYRPQLIVEYISDLESIVNQKTIEGSAGRALNYQVNARTGRPTYTKTLLSIPTTVMPINLGLYFDPLQADTTNYDLPKGWRFTYNQKIISNDEGYEYIDGRGLRHQFVEALNSINNVYYDIAGTGLILTKEGSTYKIEDGYNNYLYFNSGKLIKISKKLCYENNINEYELSFTYVDNNLVSIGEVNTISGVTTSTAKVSIDYETEDNEIVISSTGFPNIRLIKDESGYLTQIIEEDNRVNNYTYTNDSLLESAYTDNGEKVVFTYDSRFRVKTITDCVTNENNIISKLTLDYELLSTKITNYFGVTMVYVFNGEGELIGQYELQVKEGEVTTYHNMQYIDKTDETIKIYNDSGNEYLAFYDKTLAGGASLDRRIMESVAGNLTIDLETTYRLSFIYRFNKYGEESDYANSSIQVIQCGVPIAYVELDISRNRETFCNLEFNCQYTEDLSLLIYHNCDSTTIYLKNIKITKKDIKEYYLCSGEAIGNNINYGTEDSPLYPFGKTTFSCNSVDYNDSYMYYEDLIENKKRLKTNQSTWHVWYNKKRGLIAYASGLRLEKNIDLGDDSFNLGTVLIENGKIYTEYIDYVDYIDEWEYLSSHLYTKYKKVNINNITYTLSSEEINKQFQVTKKTDSSNQESTIITEYSYDEYGNLSSEKIKGDNDNKEILTIYDYDKMRLKNKVVYINGEPQTTTYQINETTGLLESITYPDGSVEVYGYYSNTYGKFKKISQTVDSVSNSNELIYDKDKVTDYIGMNDGLCLEYDKYNQISKLKNGSNTIWSIERSITPTSYIENIWYGSSSGFHISNNYDKYGNLIIRKESSNGSSYSDVLKYYYSDLDIEALNEKLLKNHSDLDIEALNEKLLKNDAELEQSLNSRLRKIEDTLIFNTKELYYDNYGNIVKVTNTNYNYKPSRIEYEYDPSNVNRLEKKIYNYGERKEIINYLNDYGNEVSGYKTELIYSVGATIKTVKPEVVYERDDLNRITKEIIKENNLVKLVREFIYSDINNKATNLVQQIKIYKNSNNLVDTLNYEYDSMGRITKVYNTSNSINNRYIYDDLGRLVRENNKQLNKSYEYTYDKNGNILSRVIGAYAEDILISTTTKSFTYSTVYTDQLTKYNNQTVYTSFAGNIIQIGSTNYTWTRATLLSRVYKSSYVYSDYHYDGSGVRYYKKVYNNGVTVEHHYLCDGNRILAEEITGGVHSGILNYLYLGNQIIGFIYKNKEYFYQKNLQGDIINIYDNTNTLVASYSYDAWGNHTITLDIDSIGSINPFRYRGYYYDRESNLYYCNARYYNPEILRWMSLDSLEYLDKKRINGCNLYCYANNNPISIAYNNSKPSSAKVTIKNVVLDINSIGFQSEEITILELNLNHLDDMFGYVEDGFSIIEGTINSYRALNKLSKLEKLGKISKKLKWFGIGIGLAADIENNFTNEDLTYMEQWRSFNVDAAYTLVSAGVSSLVSSVVANSLLKISVIAPYAALGGAVIGILASILIDLIVEESGWLDSIKERR